MFKESAVSKEVRELLFSKLNKDLNVIQDAISNELMKRGFHVKMETFNVVKNRIEFETEYFQTTPVIFKSIHVGNFGGGIISGKFHRISEKSLEGDISDTVELESYDALNVWIPVHVGYSHFDGGTNGSKLFQVNVYVTEYGIGSHSIKIK